jgi:hypothetical protein
MLRHDIAGWTFVWQVLLALTAIAATGALAIELMFYLIR